jgi:hypothetical protein
LRVFLILYWAQEKGFFAFFLCRFFFSCIEVRIIFLLICFVKDYYLFFIQVYLLDFLCLGSGAVVDKQRERKYVGGQISCEQIELLDFFN